MLLLTRARASIGVRFVSVKVLLPAPSVLTVFVTVDSDSEEHRFHGNGGFRGFFLDSSHLLPQEFKLHPTFTQMLSFVYQRAPYVSAELKNGPSCTLLFIAGVAGQRLTANANLEPAFETFTESVLVTALTAELSHVTSHGLRC